MVTPGFVLKMTLPIKLKEWYQSLKARINQDFHYEVKTDQNNNDDSNENGIVNDNKSNNGNDDLII